MPLTYSLIERKDAKAYKPGDHIVARDPVTKQEYGVVITNELAYLTLNGEHWGASYNDFETLWRFIPPAIQFFHVNGVDDAQLVTRTEFLELKNTLTATVDQVHRLAILCSQQADLISRLQDRVYNLDDRTSHQRIIGG